MAQVLKSKRADDIAFDVGSNGGRYFFSKPDPANPEVGMSLIVSDEDAAELVKRFGDSLEVIPHAKWPQRCKDKLKEYQDRRLRKAAEAFPDIVKIGVEKLLPAKPGGPKKGEVG